MKVLLSSHGAGPYGAERMLLAVARGLTRRGHEVVLDLPHGGPAVVLAERLDGVELRVGQRPRLPRDLGEGVHYALGIPASITAIRALVREVRPDVMWVNSLFNPWAALAARLAGYPVVWHLHERNLPGPLGLASSALIAITASRSVVISAYVAESYRRFVIGRDRMTILWNPLLAPVAPSAPSPDTLFTVGYVGQLEPRKRAPDLARAIGELEGVQAVFLGDGKARERLDLAVRRAGVQDRARVLGYQEDVYAEMKAFHCMAIPSLREPFGLVALEAMAAGVPVVASRSGALPEVLGDAAVYHRPKDYRDLARAIARIRDDPELRAVLRRRGLRRIDQFDYSPWMDRVEAILERVVCQVEKS